MKDEARLERSSLLLDVDDPNETTRAQSIDSAMPANGSFMSFSYSRLQLPSYFTFRSMATNAGMSMTPRPSSQVFPSFEAAVTFFR